MRILLHFLPLLTFVLIYLGSSLYLTATGTPNAFYCISPTVAIIPAIALGWLLYRGSTQERMHAFLDGMRHRDIITMCVIFLLAGAFSTVTREIGSVSATVNLAITLIPAKFMLIGLFLTAAFISTAIGSSMGTIATIAPLAAELALQGGFSAPIGMATVVGGAIFGDNLSLISDTTIAAVTSQQADLRKKFRINAIIASIASFITLGILFFVQSNTVELSHGDYTYIQIVPYLFLIILALTGVNVFIVLILSLILAFLVGYWTTGYTFLTFSQNMTTGFSSMHEIMLLSLLIGGLSGLSGKGVQHITSAINEFISIRGGVRMAQLAIAKVVSIFNLLLANNTIAIIFSGDIARDVAKRHGIPTHYSAAWLDIFSCTCQGLIPYGAQILLASSIAQISPLSIVPHVYYCFILGAVSVIYIVFTTPPPCEQHA